MREYLIWMMLLAAVLYPVYFATVYLLAKIGVLPREWVSEQTEATPYITVEPYSANKLIVVEVQTHSHTSNVCAQAA